MILDQVGEEALAVADGRVEAHRVVDEAEKVHDLVLRLAGLLRELGGRRLAAELLRELAADAQEPAHALGDVRREPDRPSLIGERAGSLPA